ncbi:DUF2508 family protein [Bacillus sp. HMF5848]|uniref:YaaL family protein n=1 Tax=Bacillus sp. HMF5848 TaxID=2495421 RepID=UPI000F7AE071|nr:YaaL family protein [Bacillus sp. HMF5848]RSK29199.1 DUF2508 family protein [Bacillus sp. HMF5848]
MVFKKKKGRLRKVYDEKVIANLHTSRELWMQKKKYVENSVEPSDTVRFEQKIAEAKYLFMLKEARLRNIVLKK